MTDDFRTPELEEALGDFLRRFGIHASIRRTFEGGGYMAYIRTRRGVEAGLGDSPLAALYDLDDQLQEAVGIA